MINFDYNGIIIAAVAAMNRYDYTDANNIGRTRFDRNVRVTVSFWELFYIQDDLYELATLRSTLNYFMHAYWKRKGKKEGKIELSTSLEHTNSYPKRTLSFIAKQKNNKNYLEIMLTENGVESKCIYLGSQEVIMMDIAIAKAIALLTPDVL